MKATGIVRKIDHLGRVVIPIELRRNLGIDVGDSLEIYVTADSIVLKKYEPGCIFCGETEGLKQYHNKKICIDCASKMANTILSA